MDAPATSQEEKLTPRIDLARYLVGLIESASSAPTPFFGDYLRFHAFFEDRLIIEIDPRRVARQFPSASLINGQNCQFAGCFLGRGSWEPYLGPLDTSLIHAEVADLIAGKGPVHDMPSYAQLCQRLARGKPVRRNLQPLDTEDKIGTYFDNLARLIASIRQNGYRPRVRRKGSPNVSPQTGHVSDIRPALVELAESEVGMAVGPSGELIRVGPGNHRMAIARQLGLTRIPVELRLLHIKWVRQEIKRQGKRPLRAIIDAVQQLQNLNPSRQPAGQTLSPGDHP